MPAIRAIPFAILLVATTAFAQMGGPSPVVVAPVEMRDLELTRPLVASVEPVTSTSLAAEEQGLVKERTFDEGQLVEKDHVLVRQDVELLQVQKQASEAAVKSAQAMIQQSRAEERNAQSEVERLGGLFERGAVTEKEYRDAQTTLEVRQAALAAREADLLARQADLQRTTVQLAKSEIRSPIRGVVQKRHVEVGQWLQQGDPVADLVQLDPLFVRVMVPESVVPQLKVGDNAKVTIDALGGTTFTAKIDQILPQAESSSRTFPVKLLLPNPEMKIRPGFFARVVAVAQQQQGVVTVPRDAVVTQGERSHVVVVRENKAAMVPVERGQAMGDFVLVKGELTTQDLVVVRGNETLRPGADVIVQNPPQPTAAGQQEQSQPGATTRPAGP